MVAGPIHLLEAGIVTDGRFAGSALAPAALSGAVAERLRPAKRIRIPFNPRDRWLSAAREACRTLADAVTATLAAGATPVILGGECTLVAGSLTGALAHERELSLAYFDAHGDFNTLATTPSHYIGGMCLAHVCGRTVAPLLWPGVRTIHEDRVALVGARALDAGEARNLDTSRLRRVAFDADHPQAPGLLGLARGRQLWVHLDLDVIDPREMPAVVMPEPDGPTHAALAEILRQLAAVSTVRGLEVCGYDPTKDAGGRLAAPIAELIAATVGGAVYAKR